MSRMAGDSHESLVHRRNCMKRCWMPAIRVLSPELQECMDPNEGSAATGARGRMSRETPKRVRAHRQERTSVPVGCERARRRNQRNLRSNPPSGSSANHGSRRRHPATLHHHPACALVVVHSSHAQALEQNGPTDHPISHRQTS